MRRDLPWRCLCLPQPHANPMKTKLNSSFFLLPSALAIAAFALYSSTPGAPAQDVIALNSNEFHRLIYSGRVLTEMAHKPELDAVCRTLLETHRRAPEGDP